MQKKTKYIFDTETTIPSDPYIDEEKYSLFNFITLRYIFLSFHPADFNKSHLPKTKDSNKSDDKDQLTSSQNIYIIIITSCETATDYLNLSIYQTKERCQKLTKETTFLVFCFIFL